MRPVVRDPDLEACFSLPGPLSALLIQCHELLQLADRRAFAQGAASLLSAEAQIELRNALQDAPPDGRAWTGARLRSGSLPSIAYADDKANDDIRRSTTADLRQWRRAGPRDR